MEIVKVLAREILDSRGNPLATPLVEKGSNEYEEDYDSVTDAMKKINKLGYNWTAEVENFGWQKFNGIKDNFSARNGEDLIFAILPKDASCVFDVYVDYDKREIRVNNFHHDSPMGAEWYYIRPVK